VLGAKGRQDEAPRLFADFSLGVVTNRDAWACGPSRGGVGEHMARMIAFYNAEADRFDAAHSASDRKTRERLVDGFVDVDPQKISWTVNLKRELVRGTRLTFDRARIVPSLYRPFTKHWLYFDRKLNERVLQVPRLFPGAWA